VINSEPDRGGYFIIVHNARSIVLKKNISRFLWDAHNCEESLRGDELGISTKYLDYWNDLNDIWFLGMQVINGLMTQVPT
jgi:hypothetical protein